MPSELDRRYDDELAKVTGPGGRLVIGRDELGRAVVENLPATLPSFFRTFCALNAENEIVGTTIPEQFDVAAGNVVAALRAAGGRPEDIVSMQIFVTDVAEYKASLGELGKVWRDRFGRRYPALALLGVTELFDEAARVELVATAVIT